MNKNVKPHSDFSKNLAEEVCKSQLATQHRLEGQIQGYESELIRLAGKVDSLSKELTKSDRLVSELQKKIKDLEESLSQSVQEKKALMARLKQYEDQEYGLHASVDRANYLKQDLEKRLNRANRRIEELEKQMIHERSLSDRKQDCFRLIARKNLLERRISLILAVHQLGITSSALIGLISGGFFWGGVGLGGGLVLLAVPGISLSQKSVWKNELNELEQKLERFSQEEKKEMEKLCLISLI